jgi:NitT/TauT family transport system substrate-binding protein
MISARSPRAMSTTDFRRRRVLCGALALPVLPWLVACSSKPAVPLRVAAHSWPGYELMFLARDEGWLPAGQVTLVPTGASTESMVLLAKGEVDASALTLDEVLRMRSEGTALTTTLVFDESAGADVLMARPQIASLQALAGRRVGAETTALGAFMLHQVFEAAGLPASAVSVVPVTSDGHLAAWQKEKLDALVTYEPVASQIEAQGGRRLFDSRKLPGQILDVLAVRRDRIEAQAEHLTAVAAGHFRALRHLQTNPQDAAFRMAGRMGLNGQDVLQTFRGLVMPGLEANRKLLESGGKLLESARRLSSIMAQTGLLPRDDTLADLSANQYLPQDLP